MNQLESMRAALLREGYTVSAVHAALAAPRGLRDEIAMRMKGVDKELCADVVAKMFDMPLPCPADFAGRAKWWAEAHARARYQQADAMMKVRG